MARPDNMNHTPAPDRQQHDPNVNQVEEMETQEGEFNPLHFFLLNLIQILIFHIGFYVRNLGVSFTFIDTKPVLIIIDKFVMTSWHQVFSIFRAQFIQITVGIFTLNLNYCEVLIVFQWQFHLVSINNRI